MCRGIHANDDRLNVQRLHRLRTGERRGFVRNGFYGGILCGGFVVYGRGGDHVVARESAGADQYGGDDQQKKREQDDPELLAIHICFPLSVLTRSEYSKEIT
ncbi:hypothetical protein SDC9_193204 [bioreactor metagenome]|uniref:Uncharacterized protein n=1 Tax=bioreactor metagenome TaxID=1076179 RepID=A0A645I441_9ZZZZ